MRRKQLIITSSLVIVTLIIIVLVAIFSRKTVVAPKNLVATDLVAANLQYTYELNQTREEKMVFFTGTSLAKLGLQPSKAPTTELLFQDFALNNVSKLRRSDSAVVVRLSYSNKESLLALDGNDQAVKNLKDGQNWFVIDSQFKIKPITFADQASIVDCIIEDKDVYVIINQANNKQSLIKHSLSTGNTTTLFSDYPATSFIGTSKGVVAFRDFKGNVALFKNGAVKQVEQNVGEALFDNISRKLVLSRVNPNEVGEEGGAPAQAATSSDKPQGPQLTILDISTEERKQINMQSYQFFISKGHVLSVPSLNQPSSLNVYNLNTNDSQTIQIDQSKTKVRDQIKNLVIINEDLSLVAAITNFNQLVLYGRQDFVADIPEYKLPIITQSQVKYGLNYNIATNKLMIYFSGGDKGVVRDSILTLKESCKCDTNQIAKEWRMTAVSSDE